MILEFPNLERVRGVLLADAMPATIATAPAEVSFLSDGRLRVRSQETLARTAATTLRRLGVVERRFVRMPAAKPVLCWYEILPLEKTHTAHPAADGQSVLFLFTEGEQLGQFVGEMLRLGNDHQALRHVTLEGMDCSLLKVHQPPCYTLLRAMERSIQHSVERPRPVAFVELRDRLWIEAGCRHPLAHQVQAPPSGSLLIRDGRAWQIVPDAPFQSVTDPSSLAPVVVPERGDPVERSERIMLPLKLLASEPTTTTRPELWILERNPVEQLKAFIGTSDNRLLERLTFAWCEQDGRTRVAVRASPSKLGPPVLVLDALALQPYLKLPNLFVPIRCRLHPWLRRDAAARTLGVCEERLTWLEPRSGGRFAIESLPARAFRPFSEWVEYQVESPPRELAPWQAPDCFDLERFTSGEEEQARQAASQARPPDDSEGKGSKSKRRPRAKHVDAGVTRQLQVTLAPLGEHETRLRELEEAFHAVEGPLDDVKRLPLWSELAAIHAVLGHRFDAALCWSHCLWDAEDPSTAQAWLTAERQSSQVAIPLDRRLPATDPTELIRLAPEVIARAGDSSQHAELTPHLAVLQQSILSAEPHLPVRTVWLLWRAIAKLSGGDVLTLAKARDRLLERLFHQGLKAELDLPGFLRRNAAHDRDRFRSIRTHIRTLHQLARRWTAGDAPATARTSDYVDLVFAFGLAKLGEAAEVRELEASADGLSAAGDRVHAWLHDAFLYRIAEVRAGNHAGLFSHEILERLQQLDKTERYKVDRLREHSRILEPHERIDASRGWRGRHGDDLDRELIHLSEIAGEPQRLRQELDKHLANRSDPQRIARLLVKGLELAPRLGSDYAERLLERTMRELDRSVEVRARAQLLERALFLAAHLGRSARVADLVGHLDHVLESLEAEELPRTIDSLLGQCCQGMRKFGLREEMTVLFDRVAQRVMGTTGAAGSRGAGRWNRDTYGKHGSELSVLLHLASGWFYFGRNSQAQAALDEVRDVLRNGRLKPDHQSAVALAYVRALGHAPTDLTVARLEELFSSITGVSDTHLSQTHFSRSQLGVIEGAVLALVSDEQLVDIASRTRLDEEEFLIRRRIHRDVDGAVKASGMNRPS